MKKNNITSLNTDENKIGGEIPIAGTEGSAPQKDDRELEIKDLNNKYLRLYAEFENYKKRVNKDKEELIKYGNEALLYELLPAVDNLELALKHAGSESTGVVHGVVITLKELHRALEKFGLSRIESAGKPFDPSVHHAMTQIEKEDMDEKMVVEELRAGYMYRDKVLRPALVAVSVKPQNKIRGQETGVFNRQEADETINNGIKINKNIEEDL